MQLRRRVSYERLGVEETAGTVAVELFTLSWLNFFLAGGVSDQRIGPSWRLIKTAICECQACDMVAGSLRWSGVRLRREAEVCAIGRRATVMAQKNAFYAQSGGVTAVINTSACGVLRTPREHSGNIAKVYAG